METIRLHKVLFIIIYLITFYFIPLKNIVIFIRHFKKKYKSYRNKKLNTYNFIILYFNNINNENII